MGRSIYRSGKVAFREAALYSPDQTGSVVIDAKVSGKVGLPFIAFAPFIGVAIGFYVFGKIWMHS
jgi:hypothetical protein